MRSNESPTFNLPILLNTRDLLAVVVGAGRVGRRKVRSPFASGAKVRVVALEPRPADMAADPRLEWRAEPSQPEHLNGARLVFTAAPAEIARRVHADAKSRRQFVCRADEFEHGDFVTPIVLRRGRGLTATVSTGGASPALARRLRQRLAGMFDETFGDWVDLLGDMRKRAFGGIWSTPEGRDEFLGRISTGRRSSASGQRAGKPSWRSSWNSPAGSAGPGRLP